MVKRRAVRLCYEVRNAERAEIDNDGGRLFWTSRTASSETGANHHLHLTATDLMRDVSRQVTVEPPRHRLCCHR